MRVRLLARITMVGALVAGAFPIVAKKNPPDPQPTDLVVEECNDVVVKGEVAYVALSRALSLMDVSDPRNPRTLSRLRLPGTVHSVAVAGNRAFLGVGSRGLAIVDVSEPEAPSLVARHDTPGSVRHVALAGGVAFLADGIRGIDIVDLSDPARLRTLASIPTRGGVRSVAVDGAVLASAEGESGVRVFDVGKPGVPHLAATLDRVGAVLDVSLCPGNTLVVALGSGGVRIYDLTTLTAPRETASISTDCHALSASCRESLLAVSCGDEGVEIWDVGKREAPRILSKLKLGRRHPAGRTSFANDLLFVAALSGGLGIVDLSDATRPQVLLPRSRRMNVRW